MPDPERPHIFISYADSDGSELAVRLQNSLDALGFEVWLDKYKLRGGDIWTREIEAAIDQCDVALALLSNGSYASNICCGEVSRLLKKGKTVIPVRVQSECEVNLLLEGYHHIDFSDQASYTRSFQQLLAALDRASEMNRPSATVLDGITLADRVVRARELNWRGSIDEVQEGVDILRQCDLEYLRGETSVNVSAAHLQRIYPRLDASYELFASSPTLDQSALEMCVRLSTAGLYAIETPVLPKVRRKWLETGLRACALLDKPKPLEMARILVCLATAYEDMGDWTAAEAFFHQCFKVSIASQNVEYAGHAKLRLAHLSIKQGLFADALVYLDDADELLGHMPRQASARLRAHSLAWRGRSLAELQRYDDGVDLLNRGLTLADQLRAPRIKNEILLQLGMAFAGKRLESMASTILTNIVKSAGEIGDFRNQLDALSALARLPGSSDQDVIESLKRLSNIAFRIGDQRILLDAETRLRHQS